MNKSIKNGFTLMETLTTISLLAIISVVLVTFYITGLKIYREKSIERDLIFATENTLKEISDDVKSATSFVQQKTLNGINYVSDADTIILEIPSVDISNRTIYTGGDVLDFDYLVYNLSNYQIIRNLYPGVNSSRTQLENKILEKDITNLTITYYPSNPPTSWTTVTKINVSITARKVFGTTSRQIQLNQTIKSRNI